MRNTVFTMAGFVTAAVLTLGASSTALAATTDRTVHASVATAHLVTNEGEGPNVAPTSGEGPNVAPTSGEGPNVAPTSGEGPNVAPTSGEGPNVAPTSGEGPNLAV